MSNMAQTDCFCLFCTQYLLHNHCTDGNLCLSQHVCEDDVKLKEPIVENPVKGCFDRPANHSVEHNGCCSRCACTLKKIPEVSKYDPYLCVSNNKKNILKMDREGPSTSNQANDTALKRKTQTQIGHVNKTGDAMTSFAARDDAGDASQDSNHSKFNINAPEFVPRTRFNSTSNSEKRLCPYAERDGFCKYPKGECTYLHGDNCDLCGRPALHPYNDALKKKHIQECIKRHERDMELAFAVARSKEKICGICFEVIMQKCKEEQRFGILPSCNHCFCLSCIRRWRQSKQFENKIIRSCPECRIASDFVCPSAFWVDTKEDKDKVIDKYKQALAKKDCKYFRFGRGKCPFGNKCFYRHCLQNGKKIDVGPPPSTNSANHPEALNDYPTTVEIIQLLEALQDVYGDFDVLLNELFFEDSDSDS